MTLTDRQHMITYVAMGRTDFPRASRIKDFSLGVISTGLPDTLSLLSLSEYQNHKLLPNKFEAETFLIFPIFFGKLYKTALERRRQLTIFFVA